MSKKANRLKNRLRMEQERHVLRANAAAELIRKIRRLEQENFDLRDRLNRERESYAKTVMVKVEQDLHEWPMWACTVKFPPEGYRFHATRATPVPTAIDLDYVARDVGYRIGEIATEAIYKHFRSKA